MPATGWPARYKIAAAASPMTTITTAAAIHGTVPAETLPASRVAMPRTDWLPRVPRNTIRFALRNSASAQ